MVHLWNASAFSAANGLTGVWVLGPFECHEERSYVNENRLVHRAPRCFLGPPPANVAVVLANGADDGPEIGQGEAFLGVLPDRCGGVQLESWESLGIGEQECSSPVVLR